MSGRANDALQKIDLSGEEPVVIDKTQEEIDAEKPPVRPPERQLKRWTVAEHERLIDRLDRMEARLSQLEGGPR